MCAPRPRGRFAGGVGPGPPPGQGWIVGDQWAPRSHQLRDFLSRNGVPFEFVAADSDRGQQLLRDFDIDAAQLPAAIHAGGRVLYDPPPADLAASHGIATRPSQPIYDLAVLGAGPAGLAAGQLSVQPHPSSFLPTVVPPDVERMCLTYQALSGLAFIGFDFKVTDAGEHVLLEANPMPGYDVFDRRLGYRISQALLDLLTTARSTGRGDQ